MREVRNELEYDARGFLVETQQQKSLGGTPVNWQTIARTDYALDSHGNPVEVRQYKPDASGQFTLPLPGSQEPKGEGTEGGRNCF